MIGTVLFAQAHTSSFLFRWACDEVCQIISRLHKKQHSACNTLQESRFLPRAHVMTIICVILGMLRSALKTNDLPTGSGCKNNTPILESGYCHPIALHGIALPYCTTLCMLRCTIYPTPTRLQGGLATVSTVVAENQGSPWGEVFPKVLRYKWEAYCDTNGMRTAMQLGVVRRMLPFILGLWHGRCCNRNCRRTAIQLEVYLLLPYFLRSSGGWGFWHSSSFGFLGISCGSGRLRHFQASSGIFRQRLWTSSAKVKEFQSDSRL